MVWCLWLLAGWYQRRVTSEFKFQGRWRHNVWNRSWSSDPLGDRVPVHERLSSMELSSRPEREQGGGEEPMGKENRQDLELGPIGEQGSSGRPSSMELSSRPSREQGGCEEPMEEEICGSEEERAIEVLIRQIGRAGDFERGMDQEVEGAGEYLRGAESNFMAQISLNDWRERHGKDTDLWPVIHWLQEDVVPTPTELKLQSPSTKHFWLCRDHLRLENRVLLYEWHHGFQKSKLLVIPKSMREAVIKLFHDAEVGGHQGREKKTKERIRQRTYWYGMATDVDIYIATCRKCSVNKRSRNPHAPLQNFQAGYPGDRVHLDMLGPFCESLQGHKYVLMIVGQFIRWLEMVPLAVQDTESVARASFESYVMRFGIPWCVHTDQGRNFDSEIVKTFCAWLEAGKTRTTPYHPSSNGQVERCNQLVLNYLR